MAKTEEQILIEKCREGETTAFGPLIGLYRRRLFGFLLRICRDRFAAEDMFQETVIKAWRGIGKYSESRKFSSWLFAIAHNTAMDELRRRRKTFTENDDREISGGTNPEEELLAKETGKILDDALDLLTEKQKEVFCSDSTAE